MGCNDTERQYNGVKYIDKNGWKKVKIKVQVELFWLNGDCVWEKRGYVQFKWVIQCSIVFFISPMLLSNDCIAFVQCQRSAILPLSTCNALYNHISNHKYCDWNSKIGSTVISIKALFQKIALCGTGAVITKKSTVSYNNHVYQSQTLFCVTPAEVAKQPSRK
jgi:hypothetical protein